MAYRAYRTAPGDRGAVTESSRAADVDRIPIH
jgi:hypothetical protein